MLCYKSEGRCFDSRLCHWEFFIDIKSFRSHYGLGFDSASDRNEYLREFPGGKGSRCLKLTLPPSCAVVMRSGNLNFLEPFGPGGRGSSLVKVLCYKSEGRWFDSRLCHWEFFIDIKSFRSHYGPGVDSASNRNEYLGEFPGGKGGRCVRLTTLPPSCAVVT